MGITNQVDYDLLHEGVVVLCKHLEGSLGLLLLYCTLLNHVVSPAGMSGKHRDNSRASGFVNSFYELRLQSLKEANVSKVLSSSKRCHELSAGYWV